MAIARTQARVNTNSSGTGAYHIDGSVSWASSAANSTIILFVGSYGAGSSNTVTIADEDANTYAADFTERPAASFRFSAFHLYNTAGGVTDITITPTAISSAIAMEYSGINSANVVDVIVSALKQNTTSTTPTSDAINTNFTDLVLGAFGTISSGNAHFASTGGVFSDVVSSHDAADGDDLFAQEALNVAASSYNAAATSDSLTSWGYVMSFRPAAVASGTIYMLGRT